MRSLSALASPLYQLEAQKQPTCPCISDFSQVAQDTVPGDTNFINAYSHGSFHSKHVRACVFSPTIIRSYQALHQRPGSYFINTYSHGSPSTNDRNSKSCVCHYVEAGPKKNSIQDVDIAGRSSASPGLVCINATLRLLYTNMIQLVLRRLLHPFLHHPGPRWSIDSIGSDPPDVW